MDDLNQVLRTLDELTAHLKRNDRPGANQTALSRTRLLAAQLSGYDPYISEKAGLIADLANVFYSEVGHRKYPGGADSLLVEMSYDLPNRITQQVGRLQRLIANNQAATDDLQ